MATSYHHLTSWVHQYPTSQVAWVATVVIGAVLLVVAGPAMVRRVRLDGDRAAWRISLLITLGLGSLAAVLALDGGYRTRIGQTFATAQASTRSATLVGRNPIPADQYYELEPNLLRNRAISGVIPEIRINNEWKRTSDNRVFRAPVVGLPLDLRASFKGSMGASPGLADMVGSWQQALKALHPGHVYVTKSLAASYGLKAGDIIVTIAGNAPVYAAVDGSVPDDQLAGPRAAVVFPLINAQQQFNYGPNISDVQVVYTSRGTAADRPTLAYIESQSLNISVARITYSAWSFLAQISVRVTGDFDRWLAIVSAGIALLVGCGLWLLGRRPKRMAMGTSTIGKTNRQESVQLHTR